MGNAVVGGSAYISSLFIIASWIDGAVESGNWHITQEVIAAFFSLCAMLAVHLTPLWKAAMKKAFGYDPYEPVKILAPFILVLGLSACAATPLSDFYALEASLTTADTIAIGYVKLPRCPQAAGACSDDDIVARIGSYRAEAYTAVTMARGIINTATSSSSDVSKAMTAAQQALAGYQQIVGGIP